MLKVSLISLGCAKNLVDSEIMVGHLHQAGMTVIPEAEHADVVIVNTCSFIDSSKEESIGHILDVHQQRGMKKRRKNQKLIVAGCMSQRFSKDLRGELHEEVDAFIGLDQVTKVAPIIQEIYAKERDLALEAPVFIEGRSTFIPDYDTPRFRLTPRHFAYVKIAEGCNHPCTFCIIPQFRGAFRSRRFESVVSEASRLFAEGVREINLIGQDTTCYGEDLGLKDGLAVLLERLAQIETPQEKWVRFLYAYPNRVTQKLLDTIAAQDSLVKYIDMPLQHASANVLKRMKRGAHADIFLKLLERIRKTIPGVAIRSSFIVGFPGETDQDFDTLCSFVQEAKLDRLGVFTYSDEETSKSFELDGKVDERTKYNRKRRLMSLQRKISKARNRGLVGREFSVLLEGPSAETDMLWEARMTTQAPEIDGVCYINDDNDTEMRPGQIRRMRVTEAHDYDVIGGLVDEAPPEIKPAAPLFPILTTRRPTAGHEVPHL